MCEAQVRELRRLEIACALDLGYGQWAGLDIQAWKLPGEDNAIFSLYSLIKDVSKQIVIIK